VLFRSEIAAYRYAHLLLRKEEPELSELQDADALLTEAARLRELGPLPHLFRLAVLHRMMHVNDRQVPLELLQRAYDRCIEEVRRGLADSNLTTDADDRRIQRQHGWINMLEFASYAIGLPYKPLEGLSDPDLAVGQEGGWKLVGRDRLLATVTYGRLLALQELSSCGAQSPGAALFYFSNDSVGSWVEISGKTETRRELHYPTGRLLVDLLLRRRRPLGVSQEASPATLRKRRERARRDLSSLTGRPASDFAVGGFSLPEDMAVFGVTAA